MPMNKLSGLSDKAFDRAYAKAMVEDHEEAVKLFQQYQRESSNKELGAFAQQTLPILEKHLHMAQTLEKSLGGK
jgi:putative membrane protein